MTHEERLETLKQIDAVIQPDDPMPEAGRKVLLVNCIRMLEREAGARTGEQIDDVHEMRVAIRRMRSALRVFDPFYRTKPVRPFNSFLRTTALKLGAVRDLDVLIENLTAYAADLDESEQAALTVISEKLNKQRDRQREKLVKWLDSKTYRKALDRFINFLTKEGKASLEPETAVTPYEVRHVAPTLITEQLNTVRAYDAILTADEMAEPDILHSLRIEFKRLRYTVDFFTDVLGTSAGDFITMIKELQDCLGALQDSVVARKRLRKLKLDDEISAVRDDYIAHIAADGAARLAQLPDLWAKFNTRTVQRRLSDALLALR